MVTMILAAVALLIALVAFVVVVPPRRPRRLAKRYAVHMKGDLPLIEGLIVRRTRRSYVLIHADLVQDAESTHSLGGTVEVPRENVYILQEIA